MFVLRVRSEKCVNAFTSLRRDFPALVFMFSWNTCVKTIVVFLLMYATLNVVSRPAMQENPEVIEEFL